MVTAVLLLSELIILFSNDISKLTHLHSKPISMTSSICLFSLSPHSQTSQLSFEDVSTNVMSCDNQPVLV